jgi:CRISPR system Cascade subunit CasD
MAATMDILVFQLQAPMSSWGEPAVGEYRGTATQPGLSALIGLLGAALGLQRQDDEGLAALRDGYGYAVALLDSGRLLRDYQTAQVPPRAALKGHPHTSRRDELAVPKRALSTVLSTRDYRVDAASLVALAPRAGYQARYDLPTLASALRNPRYPLYLGRKSCPPAAPLWPQVLEAEDALSAFSAYRTMHQSARESALNQPIHHTTQPRWHRPPLEALPTIQAVHVDGYLAAGCDITMSTPRKDRPIRRQGWQFGDRTEHLCLLSDEA